MDRSLALLRIIDCFRERDRICSTMAWDDAYVGVRKRLICFRELDVRTLGNFLGASALKLYTLFSDVASPNPHAM